MNLETKSIVIDTAEPSWKADEFTAMGYEVQHLPLVTGDYWFKHDLGQLLIERKTIPDFDRSVSIDHMFDQAEDLIEWLRDEPNRYGMVIIVGNFEGNDYTSYAQRMGALGSLLIRGCPVLTLPLVDPTTERNQEKGVVHEEYLFNYVVDKMIRSITEGKMGKFRTVDLFKYKNPDANKLMFNEKVLRLVPGISKRRASDIINEFPEINFEIKGLPEDGYKKIGGVGKKTSASIFERFGGND